MKKSTILSFAAVTLVSMLVAPSVSNAQSQASSQASSQAPGPVILPPPAGSRVVTTPSGVGIIPAPVKPTTNSVNSKVNSTIPASERNVNSKVNPNISSDAYLKPAKKPAVRKPAKPRVRNYR